MTVHIWPWTIVFLPRSILLNLIIRVQMIDVNLYQDLTGEAWINGGARFAVGRRTQDNRSQGGLGSQSPLITDFPLHISRVFGYLARRRKKDQG